MEEGLLSSIWPALKQRIGQLSAHASETSSTAEAQHKRLEEVHALAQERLEENQELRQHTTQLEYALKESKDKAHAGAKRQEQVLTDAKSTHEQMLKTLSSELQAQAERTAQLETEQVLWDEVSAQRQAHIATMAEELEKSVSARAEAHETIVRLRAAFDDLDAEVAALKQLKAKLLEEDSQFSDDMAVLCQRLDNSACPPVSATGRGSQSTCPTCSQEPPSETAALLRKELESRTTQLETVQRQLNATQRQLEDATSNMQGWLNEHASFFKEREAMLLKQEELDERQDHLDSTITTLTEDLEASRATVAELKQELEMRKTAEETAREEAQRSQEELHKAQHSHAAVCNDLRNQIAALEEALAEQKAVAMQDAQEIHAKLRRAQAQRADTEDVETIVKDLSSALKDKHLRVQQLETKLARLEHVQQLQDRLHDELATKNNEIKGLTCSLQKLEHDLKATGSKLKSKQEAAARVMRRCEKLEAKLQSNHKEWKTKYESVLQRAINAEGLLRFKEEQEAQEAKRAKDALGVPAFPSKGGQKTPQHHKQKGRSRLRAAIRLKTNPRRVLSDTSQDDEEQRAGQPSAFSDIAGQRPGAQRLAAGQSLAREDLGEGRSAEGGGAAECPDASASRDPRAAIAEDQLKQDDDGQQAQKQQEVPHHEEAQEPLNQQQRQPQELKQEGSKRKGDEREQQQGCSGYRKEPQAGFRQSPLESGDASPLTKRKKVQHSDVDDGSIPPGKDSGAADSRRCSTAAREDNAVSSAPGGVNAEGSVTAAAQQESSRTMALELQKPLETRAVVANVQQPRSILRRASSKGRAKTVSFSHTRRVTYFSSDASPASTLAGADEAGRALCVEEVLEDSRNAAETACKSPKAGDPRHSGSTTTSTTSNSSTKWTAAAGPVGPSSVKAPAKRQQTARMVLLPRVEDQGTFTKALHENNKSDLVQREDEKKIVEEREEPVKKKEEAEQERQKVEEKAKEQGAGEEKDKEYVKETDKGQEPEAGEEKEKEPEAGMEKETGMEKVGRRPYDTLRSTSSNSNNDGDGAASTGSSHDSGSHRVDGDSRSTDDATASSTRADSIATPTTLRGSASGMMVPRRLRLDSLAMLPRVELFPRGSGVYDVKTSDGRQQLDSADVWPVKAIPHAEDDSDDEFFTEGDEDADSTVSQTCHSQQQKQQQEVVQHQPQDDEAEARIESNKYQGQQTQGEPQEDDGPLRMINVAESKRLRRFLRKRYPDSIPPDGETKFSFREFYEAMQGAEHLVLQKMEQPTNERAS